MSIFARILAYEYKQFTLEVPHQLEIAQGKELLLNLFHPKHSLFPKYFSEHNISFLNHSELGNIVEREVVQCGKSAFIANSQVLREEFDYLSKAYF